MEPVQPSKLRYKVFGPFPFRTNSESTHRDALNAFWVERNNDKTPEGIANAIGVYVWTVKQGRKRIPWNVGLTDKQGFRKRFEQKETTFLRFLREDPHAQFEVYLLALQSKTGKFRRPTDSLGIKANHWLETMLIGSAISVNPDLRNKAKASYLKRAIVEGYLNDEVEERSEAAKSFNKLFKA
ncbi:hypothetical protein HDF16_003324 [Granulicella aggregans]|uniref:Uncharacterized protein n=1 Tax=Granulicella aggregans TaxID=474949 RepID=A0A7W8E5W4_9BACT|nr:hypothetical protein [Granulicella aggregans]MBB5058610.1 hypothetical protein [Granulicella aggregans]